MGSIPSRKAHTANMGTGNDMGWSNKYGKGGKGLGRIGSWPETLARITF
jgi:hypothetical protein